MDLSKLTPLDTSLSVRVDGGGYALVETLSMQSGNALANFYEHVADAEFYVLARKADDIQMRRGWGVLRANDGQWYAQGDDFWEAIEKAGCGMIYAEKPCLALVAAEAWYVQHCTPGKDREP